MAEELLIDPIFKEFRKNVVAMSILKDAHRVIAHGDSLMRLRMLQIEDTNASCRTSFSNATCTVSAIDTNSTFGIAKCSIGSLFEDGMEDLCRYLNERPCISDDQPSRLALAKLLKFINYSLRSIMPPMVKDKGECERAALLAQHLFSKLAADSKFTLDSHYSEESVKTGDEQLVCPCGKSDQLGGSFGDTSFGCPNAWHGSVDILLENIPVTVTGTPDCRQGGKERLPSDSSDNGNESSVEVKTGTTFNKKELDQLLSQCIVFSFLQNKQLANSDVSLLVPSIGINTSQVIVHFYDCKNDVLFQSATLELFNNYKQLNVGTIVFLWLTLNYRYFCSGLTDDMKGYKANFRSIITPAYLQKYEKEVIRPVPRISYTDLGEVEKSWALNFGLPLVVGVKRKRDYSEIA